MPWEYFLHVIKLRYTQLYNSRYINVNYFVLLLAKQLIQDIVIVCINCSTIKLIAILESSHWTWKYQNIYY